MLEELEVLENYYKDFSVYKTVFICGTENYDQIYNDLVNLDHNILKIKLGTDGAEQVNGEITYIPDLENFATSHQRILLTDIEYWKENKDVLQKYVMPYQNLLVLYDISDYQKIQIQNWLKIFYLNNPTINVTEPMILDLDDY